MTFESKEHKINYLKKLIREEEHRIFISHRQIEQHKAEIRRLEKCVSV